MRAPTLELMCYPLQIVIVDATTNRATRLDAEKWHTVGSILDTVVGAMNLPRDRSYALVFGGKELGADKYSISLEAAGVREGDRFDLIARPRGG